MTGCAKSSPDKSRTGGGDLAALLGRWDLLPAEPGGAGTPRQRVFKEVSGNTETITTYGPGQNVVRVQTAKFRLARSGPVCVFIVEDPQVTAGEGTASRRRMQYVYRVHGNEFDEVWGLLPGQEEREVVVKRWKRATSGQ